MSGIEDNKALVRRFMEAFSQADYKTALGLLDDEATWWVAGTLPISGTHTKAAFTTLLDGIGDIVEGAISLSPKAFTAEGNRVAVETESFARTRNGRIYNNFYHFLFEIRGDKILRVKEYLDTMHTMAVICTP
jgi:ketosteroid isomerase-like protein